ncbi:MAG: DUF4357 domain-containing protein, partial [Cyclobacteriaceae bacterium]|nr:DUF4357 domain-containing protein [Cyclobacteriaceae bacterium]
NKAHIKYLESRLYEIARTVGRYKLDNSSTPTQSSIAESDRAEMEEFIENIKLLVNTLGHKVFDEKRESRPLRKQNIFYIKAARGANAQGEPTSEGFLVLKGSHAAGSTVASMTSSFINLRNKLIDQGVLIHVNDIYEFPEDFIFSSPSTAATIVLGRNANGPGLFHFVKKLIRVCLSASWQP